MGFVMKPYKERVRFQNICYPPLSLSKPMGAFGFLSLGIGGLDGSAVLILGSGMEFHARDVVALRAKPQKPVLQGQKTKQS